MGGWHGSESGEFKAGLKVGGILADGRRVADERECCEIQGFFLRVVWGKRNDAAQWTQSILLAIGCGRLGLLS